MLNPFIKLTGALPDEVFYVNVLKISSYHGQVDKSLVPNGNTVIIDSMSGGRCVVATETTEEVSAMIQKYYDEKMRLGFIHSALTWMCSDSDEFPTWDSVSRSAINIGDMVMEELKDD